MVNPHSPGMGEEAARATEALVEKFGGIRPMAGKLGIPVTTVQGWKKRGHVPENRRADILAAAASHDISLTEEELDRAISLLPEEAEGGETPPPPHPEPQIIDVEPEQIAPSPAPDPVAPMPPPEMPSRPATAVPDPDAEPKQDGPAETPPPPHAPPPEPPARDTAQRTSRIGAAAFVVALVGLGTGVFGLMRHGDLPGLGRTAEAPASATELEAMRVQVAALSGDLEQARAEIGRLQQQAADAPPPTEIPAPIAALPEQVDALSRELESLRGAIQALPAIPTEGNASDPAALDALRQDVERLAGEVQSLASRPAPSGGEPVDLSPVVQAVNDLGSRVSALESAPPPAAEGGGADPARVAALESALGDLGSRLERLENRVYTLPTAIAGGAEGEALLVAANQLQAALNAGRPYGAELRAVQALAAGVPQLEPLLADLAPRAEQGLPTATALRTRFDGLATEIIQAKRLRTDASWMDQTLGRMSSLVTVRRASGEVAGDSVQAVVSRAEAALDTGDLAHAVEELSTLSGPAAEAAAPWLTDARARVAAERAARAAGEFAVARLSGGAGQ